MPDGANCPTDYPHPHTVHMLQGGEISICFGNEFSTIAHKTVYFDLIKDTDDNGPVLDSEQHHATLTQMETSLTAIHDSLKKVVDYQVGEGRGGGRIVLGCRI